MKLSEKIRDFVTQRQQAYQQVFNPENTFLREVMDDLEKFCRENESAFHSDDRVHALLEGRREVLLRIKRHLNLNTEDLIKYHTNKGTNND